MLAVATTGRAQLPARIPDGEFNRLFAELSEPNGSWRSDNILSNEASFQQAIPALVARTSPGGVYLGVGPEQNFTYIAALRPRLAFVFDIRRGNALELLLYKALFEMSPTRADFVSRLFSRPRPPGLDTSATAAVLFAAYERVPHDSALYTATLAAVYDRLVRTHGVSLSGDDRRGIAYVFDAFFAQGPNMDYNTMGGPGTGYRRFGRGWRPTYADLMTAADARGVAHGYLASEANYRFVRDMQLENRIVPVVGDFAGPKALRAVGAYLRAHGATVTAFYTSNVEQYLFVQGDDWRRFYANVAALPLDSTSTFVRAVFRSGMPGLSVGPGGSITVWSSMPATVTAYQAGRLATYAAVVAMSH